MTVTTKKVVTTGLNDPRGLRFGPDGLLYVAEAGTGGKKLSKCTPQVVPPIGPYKGSNVGSRISRIDWHGVRTTGIGPPGAGEILQIGFKCEEVSGDKKK